MARPYTGWSNELIIKTLQELNNSNADLRDINAQSSYYKLYKAACYHLRSWRKALEQAGINYKDIQKRVYGERRKQEKEELLEKLKSAYESGVKLDSGSIKADPEHRILYWKAEKFYSGRTRWEDALKDAGLNPLEIVVQERWTKQKIRAAILERKRKGLALNAAAIAEEDAKLSRAINHHFKSNIDALKYSKINPNKVVRARARSDEELVISILSYHIKGTNLGTRYVRSKKNRELKKIYHAASRRFAGWRNALIFCGIDPKLYFKKQEWDKEKIKKGITELYEQGSDLHSSFMMENNYPVYKAGMRHFGSWKNAIEAVGLDYKKINKAKPSLSAEEIISGITEAANQGINLDYTSIAEQEPHIRRLFFQACRKFDGGWEEAIGKAGFNYDEIRLRKKKYTIEELTEEVKALEKQGKSLDALSVISDPSTNKIHHAVSRRFSDWYVFLDEIGIDSSKYRKKRNWKNGDSVLETLREMFPSGIMTGIKGKDRNLAAAICAYFRSVGNAAEKAGLVYSRYGKISKKLLKKLLKEHPKIIGILYKSNAQFIGGIAKRVYYSSLAKGIRPESTEDLEQEAFLTFVEYLPKKPAKTDLRNFIYSPIYNRLLEINRENTKRARKEHLWGHFDLADSVERF